MAEFFTIGHSTHPLAEFIGLLRSAGVTLVVDVRTVPRSRVNPQFNAESLPQALQSAGISYRHLGALGGLRGRTRAPFVSANTFWENASFRNYADYTATEEFQRGLQSLRKLGRSDRCAMMCAEAVWWRCHRRIIADYLISEGEMVFHIMANGKLESAHLTQAAQRTPDGTLIYPAKEQ